MAQFGSFHPLILSFHQYRLFFPVFIVLMNKGHRLVFTMDGGAETCTRHEMAKKLGINDLQKETLFQLQSHLSK
jgi:hypothetical protein